MGEVLVEEPTLLIAGAPAYDTKTVISKCDDTLLAQVPYHTSLKCYYDNMRDGREAIYGPDHPEVARDVNNLGGVLYNLGDFDGAKAAFKRGLKIAETVYGPDHPTT